MKHLLIIALCFISYSLTYGQIEKIKVIIPDSENESEYILQNIKEIRFFDNNGYSVSLPKNNFIDKLLKKSRCGLSIDSDFDSLALIMKNIIYNKDDYQKGFDKIMNRLPIIDQAVSFMHDSIKIPGFYFPQEYHVKLTLYGPGGSYNAEEGEILLLATPEGNFKNTNNPEYTIIHEIVHIGIENSVVVKYNLSHTLKERIVDSFVKNYFSRILPDYKLQSFGDKRIDKYLKNESDFENINRRIEQFIEENK